MEKLILPAFVCVLIAFSNFSYSGSVIQFSDCSFFIPLEFENLEAGSNVYFQDRETGSGVIYIRSLEQQPLSHYFDNEKFSLKYENIDEEMKKYFFVYKVGEQDIAREMTVGLVIIGDNYLEILGMDLDFVLAMTCGEKAQKNEKK